MTDESELSLGSGFCVCVGECRVVVGRRCQRLESPEVLELEMLELEWSMESEMLVLVLVSELVSELESEPGVP